ncbi:hypothetical protein M8J77_000498 [Diaphorina citri]|nr:hypothetical protein M8J77_000498 [Diaphorina citri]
MEVQPTIKQFFKSRKRPVSILKKDQELNERPSKVFVTEKKLGIVDEKSLLSKVVYTSSTQSADDEVSEINNAAVTEKSASTSASTSNEKPTLAADPARPSTPENFISVEPPKTPSTIRNAEPTTPSHKNVLPERPSTPESNVEALEAIQKETLTGINDLKRKVRIQRKLLSAKQSLERLNQQNSRLEAIQNALREADVALPRDRDEPISPRKGPLKQRLIFPREKSSYSSPTKQYVSPRKLLLDGPVNITSSPVKEPAYKRYADLTAIQEKGTLNLPFKYRMLAEIFRAVDTIVSMIHTRGENITFEKLQAGVQSMIKKNLTHQHLGQIKTVLPNAYSYLVEKIHKFGTSAGQADKYELLIKPILKSGNSETSHCSMNSALLLNRRRDFHKKLMDFAKQYHEEFLLALVPPVFLEKDKLTRWHPDFELDKVPDIPAQDIPLPKPQATNTSVKQILEQAKSLLSCNKKMGAALNQIKDPKVPAASSSGQEKEPTTPSSSTSDPGSSQAVVENLQKVIKGIPQGLLEKVRARQAAKALASMTQSPADIQEAVMLSRLPEMARILRVLYVAEKRTVLPLDNVVHRIAHSFREHLSPGKS